VSEPAATNVNASDDSVDKNVESPNQHTKILRIPRNRNIEIQVRAHSVQAVPEAT
jgi:hypothetical protein